MNLSQLAEISIKSAAQLKDVPKFQAVPAKTPVAQPARGPDPAKMFSTVGARPVPAPQPAPQPAKPSLSSLSVNPTKDMNLGEKALYSLGQGVSNVGDWVQDVGRGVKQEFTGGPNGAGPGDWDYNRPVGMSADQYRATGR